MTATTTNKNLINFIIEDTGSRIKLHLVVRLTKIHKELAWD